MPPTWNEDLPVALTRDELFERGERLALQDQLLADAEAARKQSALEHKGKINDIKSERSRLALIVRERAESRPVPVTKVEHFARGVTDIVRTDTGEVVRSKAMTDDERQSDLPGTALLTPIDDIAATIAIRQLAMDQGKSDSEADAAVEAWRAMPEQERERMLAEATAVTGRPREPKVGGAKAAKAAKVH